jgi:hypothetical protein
MSLYDDYTQLFKTLCIVTPKRQNAESRVIEISRKSTRGIKFLKDAIYT